MGKPKKCLKFWQIYVQQRYIPRYCISNRIIIKVITLWNLCCVYKEASFPWNSTRLPYFIVRSCRLQSIGVLWNLLSHQLASRVCVLGWFEIAQREGWQKITLHYGTADFRFLYFIVHNCLFPNEKLFCEIGWEISYEEKWQVYYERLFEIEPNKRWQKSSSWHRQVTLGFGNALLYSSLFLYIWHGEYTCEIGGRSRNHIVVEGFLLPQRIYHEH